MKRRHYLRPIFLLLLGGGVLTIAYIFVISYLENQVEEKLVSIRAKSSSIRINLFTRSLHLQQLEIPPSVEIPIGIHVKSLDIKGIQLSSLLADKTIAINTIRADSGRLLYNKSIDKTPMDSIHLKPKSFEVKNLSLANIIAEIRTDTLVNFSCVLNCEATATTFEINSSKPDFTAKTLDVNSKDINISRNEGMYGMTIDQVRYSSEEQTITFDSVLLIPNYSKFDFAHQKGEQVGRINLSAPQLVIVGIAPDELIDTVFTASKIEITSFDLHSFKDKRVPFLRTKHIPLPMESFQRLPYSITADTIIINDSRVTIEEISEMGTASGGVTIDHINATCGRVTNRYIKGVEKYAVLKASGMMMNQGEISAVFSLPLDGFSTYHTTGRISNFPFEKLNPALENLARFKIESGRLNAMKFNFRYNDFRSIGTMEIDYEDLKIIGLKKNNDDTSDFKTLFINAIVKDNKDRSLAKVERTGTINIERDRRRYIFNVWWRSILDGLRSSILGIEKKQIQKK